MMVVIAGRLGRAVIARLFYTAHNAADQTCHLIGADNGKQSSEKIRIIR